MNQIIIKKQRVLLCSFTLDLVFPDNNRKQNELIKRTTYDSFTYTNAPHEYVPRKYKGTGSNLD